MTMMMPSACSVNTGNQSLPKAAPDVTSEPTIHVRVSTAMILRTSTSDLNAYLKVLEIYSDLFLFFINSVSHTKQQSEMVNMKFLTIFIQASRFAPCMGQEQDKIPSITQVKIKFDQHFFHMCLI
jgi:hypothetical protein